MTIQFSWHHNAEEEVGITCEILTPTQLVEDDAFGGGIASSTQITWFDAEDGDGSIIPIVAAIFIAVAGMAAFLLRISKKSQDEDEDMLF